MEAVAVWPWERRVSTPPSSVVYSAVLGCLSVMTETLFLPELVFQFMSALNHCLAKFRFWSLCVQRWTCKGNQALPISLFIHLRTTGWSPLKTPGLNRVLWEGDGAFSHNTSQKHCGSRIESENNLGWKRPLTSHPTIMPAPLFSQLNHVPKCH